METHDIIVIGSSAGGVEALLQLAPRLSIGLAAAVFVVQHVSPSYPSVLPGLLSRAGPLPATHPRDGESVVQGRIYLAPPDHHLVVQPGSMRVVRGPKENGHRPAADVLFRSASRAYGPRVIGVVLTGALDDGTAGLLAVKRRGGLAVVQDPATAFCADMPRSALEHVPVDHSVRLEELPELLQRLVRLPVPRGQVTRLPRSEDELEAELAMASIDPEHLHQDNKYGTPSVLTCPECSGTLYQIQEEGLERYRCRVGHAFTPASLLRGQHEYLESALWAALRALEEHASLARRLATQAQERHHVRTALQFSERAQAAEQQALLLRTTLLEGVASGQPEQTETDRVEPGSATREQLPGGSKSGKRKPRGARSS